ncbi:Uncharacterised protein [Klebsiella pneumoniae]|uniref:Uncharacterized protein n=1 Tax=Klebsiella pneumoniae TaxID=573 RepID=A0A2X3D368_KLEPN|nr:Uncharacterised protein [Klebsiella pneumoniae]
MLRHIASSVSVSSVWPLFSFPLVGSALTSTGGGFHEVGKLLTAFFSTAQGQIHIAVRRGNLSSSHGTINQLCGAFVIQCFQASLCCFRTVQRQLMGLHRNKLRQVRVLCAVQCDRFAVLMVWIADTASSIDAVAASPSTVAICTGTVMVFSELSAGKYRLGLLVRPTLDSSVT